MKHLLTILLLTLTTLSYAQVNETELIGEPMGTIVEVKGHYDDYGFNNGKPYIAYYHENQEHGTIFYFDNNLCNKIYVVMEFRYKYAARRFLNKNYYQLNRNKWLDLSENIKLYLLEIKDTITVKIVN